MGEHLKTHVASMPWVKCPAKNLTTPLGESGQTSLGKFIIEYIRVWPPSSWSLLHFHLRIRVRPQMLTKLVGEWPCMLVSVHYFHVGSEFSFQWPQTDVFAQWLGNRPRMYFPDAPAAGPPPWIKALEYTHGLDQTWLYLSPLDTMTWATYSNFLLLSASTKSFRYMSYLWMFHLEHWQWDENITKSKHMSS